jgi:hypothetical protein
MLGLTVRGLYTLSPNTSGGRVLALTAFFASVLMASIYTGAFFTHRTVKSLQVSDVVTSRILKDSSARSSRNLHHIILVKTLLHSYNIQPHSLAPIDPGSLAHIVFSKC